MDYVKKLFSGDNKYKTVGLLLVVLLCLIAASLYVYKKSISSKIKDTYAPNQEFVSNDADKSAILYYFYTTWCPHCKKTMPIWDELVSELSNKELNGVILTLIKVDCDKEQALAESFNVQGYPTIKLVYGDKTVEYDAKLDKSTLMEFLNSTL